LDVRGKHLRNASCSNTSSGASAPTWARAASTASVATRRLQPAVTSALIAFTRVVATSHFDGVGVTLSVEFDGVPLLVAGSAEVDASLLVVGCDGVDVARFVVPSSARAASALDDACGR
jgi:hypothetical protein